MKKFTQVLLSLFLTSLFVLASLGCLSCAPGSQDSKESLIAVIGGFSNAMAELDFETAKTFCTEELWVDVFAEMEEGMDDLRDMLSEEELDKMMGDMTEEFDMEEEMTEGIDSAVAEFDGDDARLIFNEDGEESYMEFKKVNGRWVISEFDWSLD